MSGIPSVFAQDMVLAQDTPLQSWFNGWLAYLSDNLPAIFLVVAVLVGTVLIMRAGIKQAVIFAVGAALAFVLLTNLESVASFIGDELPLRLDGDSSVVEGPADSSTPGDD